MTNLTSLDLSGLDTSNVTDPSIAFDSCKSLTEINIGTKTLDQNILLDIEDAKFLAKNGTGELYSPAELRNAITLGNIGWYSIVPCGNWGTCSWDLIDNVLTIHKGTGKGVDFVDGLDLPWCQYRESINSIVMTEKVLAPTCIRYLFCNMPNLTSADLSGFDTAFVNTSHDIFANCNNLNEIKIGPHTFSSQVFIDTDLPKKRFVPQSGGDPVLPTDLPSVINADNTGWYDVVEAD